LEQVDKRFALIAVDGTVLYPYRKKERSTQREGFALSQPGSGDRHEQGIYTDDIELVIRRVILDGWKVRAKSLDGKRHGSFAFGKKAVNAYAVAKEFAHIVRTAAVQSVALP
jgi:hypothetical protein